MTNQTKVKLPRDVAEAIGELKSNGWKKHSIVVATFDGESYFDNSFQEEIDILRRYFTLNETREPLLLSALVNGYEIEKSPEELEAERKEELREYYESLYEEREKLTSREFGFTDKYTFGSGVLFGIEKTLNLLGITIEGINDKEESE